MRKTFLPITRSGIAAAMAALPVIVSAQGADRYPSRPISVVIPFAPGGSTDNEARLYTDKVSRGLGQSLVFDYRAGAASSIGVAHALKAEPDGYTLLITNAGITVFPNFYPQLNAQVIKTLVPITELSNRSTAMLISPKALPNVNSVKDLIAHAKTHPGALYCNTAGAGGITHTVCASMSLSMDIPITPVHYKGVALGQIDLVAGRTQLSGGTLFQAMPQIRRGALRAIAVMGRERSSLMPDLPTSYEQGVKIDYPSWLGAYAPPGTPSAIIQKLNSEFVKAVKSPDVVKHLEKQGSIAIGSSPAEFAKKMESELAYWRDIVARAGITIDTQ